MVDVHKNLVCLRFGVCIMNVLFNPIYEMVLKRSFDDLVEEIR